jgi:hypothetical protein
MAALIFYGFEKCPRLELQRQGHQQQQQQQINANRTDEQNQSDMRQDQRNCILIILKPPPPCSMQLTASFFKGTFLEVQTERPCLVTYKSKTMNSLHLL